MNVTAKDIESFEALLTDGKQKLAEKAGQDAAFHDALKNNPKETIEKLFNLPEGTLKEVTVEIFEEKPQTIGIVVPPRPAEGVELSDEQLEAVAGGAVFGVAATAAAIGGKLAAGGTVVGTVAGFGVSKGW